MSLNLKKYLILSFIFLFACEQSKFDEAMIAYELNDYKTAINLFTNLAKNGDSRAQAKLALMYEQGNGLKLNIEESIKWHIKAAEGGESESQAKIAGFYLRGSNGFKKDIWKAMKWFRKAAVQGNSESVANIAYMFYEGIGVKQDYIEASKWYKKAADKGFLSSQHDLGIIYQHGYGFNRDYEKANSWYRKAANQGFIHSQDNLLYMYKKGFGVPVKEEHLKFKWFLEIAKKGDITAQYLVGDLYYHGKGIPNSDIKSYAWLGVAAANGYKAAISLRNKVELSLDDKELNNSRDYARKLWVKYGNKDNTKKDYK